MSDNFEIRPFPGYGRLLSQRLRTCTLPKKRLVEECEIVYIYALQQAVGKKALLAAIRAGRPFRLSLPGGDAEIWLTDEIHRLPGGIERWSSPEDGTARLWLWCTGCRRHVAKLYYFRLPGSPTRRSDLLCRRCHRLTYQVNNCGGNRWYREVARPLKRLLRRRERLLRRKPTTKVQGWLAIIDRKIQAYQAALAPKPSRRRRILPAGRRERRLYRDARHLLDPLPVYVLNSDVAVADVRRAAPTGELSETGIGRAD